MSTQPHQYNNVNSTAPTQLYQHQHNHISPITSYHTCQSKHTCSTASAQPYQHNQIISNTSDQSCLCKYIIPTTSTQSNQFNHINPNASPQSHQSNCEIVTEFVNVNKLHMYVCTCMYVQKDWCRIYTR